jgi:hypothetical protein
MVLTNWSFSVTLDYYAGPPRDSLTTSRHLVYPPVLNREMVVDAIHSGQPVYLIESHYPSRGVRWLYPPGIRQKHYERFAFLPTMERTLGVSGAVVYAPFDGPKVYRLALRPAS